MKFRSCVLGSCMLVVPMLAMFSHRIPAEVREACRTHLWQPAAATVAGLVGQGAAEPPARVEPAAAAPGVPTAIVASPPAQPANAGGPAALANPGVPPTLPHLAAAAPPAAAEPHPATVASPVPAPQVPSPPTAAAGSDRRRIVETSLAKLGAVSIRCDPLPGHEGMHVGSCHVAIDASGQLQRVFQAAAADPDTALEHLLDEVLAWRSRALVRQAEDAPATRSGGALRL